MVGERAGGAATKASIAFTALAALMSMHAPARAANEQTSLAIPAYVILFLAEYVAEDQLKSCDALFSTEYAK